MQPRPDSVKAIMGAANVKRSASSACFSKHPGARGRIPIGAGTSEFGCRLIGRELFGETMQEHA